MRVVHNGLVWVVAVENGWYTHLKPFPGARSVEDPRVVKYAKEAGLL